jgi:hypothetical protein
MFWLGIAGIILIAVAFLLLMKYLHNKIDELENL